MKQKLQKLFDEVRDITSRQEFKLFSAMMSLIVATFLFATFWIDPMVSGIWKPIVGGVLLFWCLKKSRLLPKMYVFGAALLFVRFLVDMDIYGRQEDRMWTLFIALVFTTVALLTREYWHEKGAY